MTGSTEITQFVEVTIEARTPGALPCLTTGCAGEVSPGPFPLAHVFMSQEALKFTQYCSKCLEESTP